jgi:RNA polymerase sigma factor (sigma-70 family)
LAAAEALRAGGCGWMLARMDPDDIGAFYAREMPRLVLFVMTTVHGLDWHAAADVAQTAFERALPRWAGLSQPKAWLYTVARNEALARCAAMRRELPAEVLPERADEISAALEAELRDEEREVLGLLAELPGKQQEVMRWTMAGLNDAEIAGLLQITTDAVKHNRLYARKKLRKRLGARKEGTR